MLRSAPDGAVRAASPPAWARACSRRTAPRSPGSMTGGRPPAQQHHRARARRAQRRGHAPRRPVGRGGLQLPRTPDVGHRRRHHRDGPQQHQRAGARHAPGADRRQEHPVPRRPEGPARELSSRTDPPTRSWDRPLATPVPRSWWVTRSGLPVAFAFSASGEPTSLPKTGLPLFPTTNFPFFRVTV